MKTPTLYILCFLIFTIPNLQAQWDNAILENVSENNVRDFVTAKQSFVIDDFDNLHLTWASADSIGSYVYYRKRSANGTWEEAIIVSLGDYSFSPVIDVVPGTEKPIIAYLRHTDIPSAVYLAYFDEDVFKPLKLTISDFEWYSPSIDIDDSGAVHLAWIGKIPSGAYKIFYTLATVPNISWNTEQLVQSNLGDFGSGADPYIAFSPETGPVISYRGGSAANYSINVANKKPASWTWDIDIVSTPNADDYTSALAITGDSVHMVVSGNDGFGIGGAGYYLYKQIDEWWSSPEKVNATSNGVVSSSLVIDKSGHVHTIWEEIIGNILEGNINYSTNASGSWESTPLLSKGDLHFATLAFNSLSEGFVFAEQEDIITFDLDKGEAILFGNPGMTDALDPDLDFEQKVSVYPNPVFSEIFFQKFDNQLVADKIQLVDSEGKLVLEKEIQDGNSITLDRNGLSSGIYFYRIFEEEELVGRGKIVVE